MIDFLTNERDKVNWHDMECVVLIIMSHGETNGIYGTDGKLKKLKDMTDIFNSSQCHGLDLKPRLVFVQACRGGKCSYCGIFVFDEKVWFMVFYATAIFII